MYTAIIKDLARRLAYHQIEKAKESEVVPQVKKQLRSLLSDLYAPFLRGTTNYLDVYEVDIRGYSECSGGLDLNMSFEDVLRIDKRGLEDQRSKFLLVPVFGFTESLHFLTRCGGGMYDKYIELHPNTVTVGIATEARSVFFVPEPHDKPLDYIVTEKRILELW